MVHFAIFNLAPFFSKKERFAVSLLDHTASNRGATQLLLRAQAERPQAEQQLVKAEQAQNLVVFIFYPNIKYLGDLHFSLSSGDGGTAQ